MALISCPECSGNVSDAAPTCPHCGTPISAANEPAQQTSALGQMDVVRGTGTVLILGLAALVVFALLVRACA